MFNSNLMLLNPNRGARVFGHLNQAEPRSPRKHFITALLVAFLAAAALLIHLLMPLSWNVATTLAVQSVSFPGLQETMRLISGFGNAPKVVIITVIALIACNKRREAFFVTLSGLGGWFVAMQLKHLFASQRPTSTLLMSFINGPPAVFLRVIWFSTSATSVFSILSRAKSCR